MQGKQAAPLQTVRAATAGAPLGAPSSSMPSRKSKSKTNTKPAPSAAAKPSEKKDSKSSRKTRRRRIRDARGFVDAVFAEQDGVKAAAKLLGKERFLEKLIELRFGKPSAAPEAADSPRRIVFNVPRPAREREEENEQ
jgi:hypothetical protein